MTETRTPTMARGARWLLDSLTVLGFLAAIAAPTADFWFRPDDNVRSPLSREARIPAPRPAAPRTAQEAIAYPAQYEAYFKDSFGLRDKLLRWNSAVKVFGFGVSPSSEVYFGRDHWLFYTGEHTRENHRGAFPFKTSELERWARMLERKRALLESMGVRYLYVVAPDKESVYPELMPDFMRPIGPTRLDQWLDFLREHAPQIEILDLRPALISAKHADAPDEYVYTDLGTHWSGRGSQVALRTILARMNSIAPGGFALEEVDDFRRVDFAGTGDSWAIKMYIQDLLTMRIHGYMPKTTHSIVRYEGNFRWGRVRKSEIENSSRPRVVLMHDSFGPHIEQGLAEQCSYLECHWETAIDSADIEAAHPQILVDLYVERILNHLDPIKLLPKEEHPWTGRFGKSATTLVKLDTTLENWGLTARGGAVVGPAASARRPRIPLTVKNPWDLVGLPPLTVTGDEVPVLHICIDSPFNTEFTLYYKPEGQADFIRHDAYRHALVPGANEVYMPLDKPGTSGELVLRPGVLPGTYLLRDFEIRAVPRAP